MELIHPSSIGKIMTDPVSIDKDLLTKEAFARLGIFAPIDDIKEIIKKKTKTEDDKKILEVFWDHSLSAGAKTYLKSIAKTICYDFKKEVDVKAFSKGKMCEDAAIELINSVYFKSYKKHVGRIETDLMSGECDILVPKTLVRDVKNAWSLDTFPVFIEDAHTTDYEFQLRGYMHLYDVPEAFLDWCLVDTPDELIKWEPEHLHRVSHIDPCMRVTTVHYTRDLEIERKMLIRCKEAQLFIERMKKQILIDHEYSF